MATPRTITLSIRLRTSEYDELCKHATARAEDVAEVSRRAIRRLLNE